MEKVGEYQCYVVEAVVKNRGKYIIWLDPEHGYNIAQAMVRKGENAILYGKSPGKIKVNTMINGEAVSFLCEPYQSLLSCLRDILGLTGTKEGCSDGNCGACSVILDGRLINSCLVLGPEVEGSQIITVEGLANWQGLHPIQQTFLDENALQCGFCTPGFLMATKVLLDNEPNPSEERIREWLAGNLCRCTGYDKIVHAVRSAAAILSTQQEEVAYD